MEKLFEYLRTEWAYFLFIRDDAERKRALPPSTAPSLPAPGRRLLIIRTDTQIAPAGSFLTFNGTIPSSPAMPMEPVQSNARRPSTVSQASADDFQPLPRPPTESETDAERETGLRSFLRGIMGGSTKKKSQSRSTSRPSSQKGSPTPTPPSGLVRSATDDPNVPQRRESTTTPPPRATPNPPQEQTHRTFCFKFSLEFSQRPIWPPNHPHAPPSNLRLFAPRLPMPAQQYLQARAPGIPAMRPQEPRGAHKARAGYVGRALAEWALVVGECQGFFERRRGEGVPSDRLVETPTLGVEVFRRSP